MFPLDLDILQLVQSGIRPWLTTTMRIVSWVFTPEIIVPTMAVVVLLLYLKHKRLLDVLLVLLLAGNVLTLVLKPLINHPRPTATEATVLDVQGSYGFPSGHALAAMTVVGALLLLIYRGHRVHRWVIVMASIIIFVVGYSRVYLGAHWPSDVIGGWVIGWLWLWFVWSFVQPRVAKYCS